MKKLLAHDSVNTVQSIKKYYKLEQEHPSNPLLDEMFEKHKPKHVILMCLDGLGYSFLNHTPYFNENVLEKVDTVFPPTTACATITLQTGLYPCEHGWIGWSQYFKGFDDCIELFTGKSFYTDDVYDYNEVIKDIKFDAFYNHIENSKIYFPGADKFYPNNYETIKAQFDEVKKQINENENTFSYMYWNEPDGILHREGSKSQNVINLIKEIESQVKEGISLLEDVLVIVTADHGHIDNEIIEIRDHPEILECLVTKPSIEPRFTNFFIKEGYEKKFIDAINPFLDKFDLYSKEEFLNLEFFNRGVHHFKINEFLGDYVLIANDKYILNLKDKFYASAHAGCTEIEMEIPLIVIAK
ncbi:MAG: alkaline phosphatase family protein [bacterium]